MRHVGRMVIILLHLTAFTTSMQSFGVLTSVDVMDLQLGICHMTHIRPFLITRNTVFMRLPKRPKLPPALILNHKVLEGGVAVGWD